MPILSRLRIVPSYMNYITKFVNPHTKVMYLSDL